MVLNRLVTVSPERSKIGGPFAVKAESYTHICAEENPSGVSRSRRQGSAAWRKKKTGRKRHEGTDGSVRYFDSQRMMRNCPVVIHFLSLCLITSQTHKPPVFIGGLIIAGGGCAQHRKKLYSEAL